MKQEQIDKLNNGIKVIIEEFNCDWLTAMESIALAAQLTKAKVSDEGDATIYKAPDGTLVNCWLEGVEVGFDDQTEWYTNIVACEVCGCKFDWTQDPDHQETDTGDVCGDCVRDSEANIAQPEYPDDPAIS